MTRPVSSWELRDIRRLVEKIDFKGPDECWPWAAALDQKGYGVFNLQPGKQLRAHRAAYMLHARKDLEQNVFVCHSCDNPPCCNPAHLFTGSQKDNMRDMSRKGRAREQLKTHCVHGHERNETNTYVYRGRKCCRVCNRFAARRLAERKRA